jgi:hypothetical protein
MQTSVDAAGNPLLAEDVANLAEILGRPVEILCEGSQIGVVVRALTLPDGIYNIKTSDLLMQSTIQYPATEMDMFWVQEDLRLADGRMPQGADSVEMHFGQHWRRFSWHRNAPWHPGRDSLLGHFEFALARLQRPE